MIRVLICDGDGTLHLPSPPDEVFELVNRLEDIGIELAVASNSAEEVVRSRFENASLNQPEVVVTPHTDEIDKPKPSPEFVNYIAEYYGVKKNKVAYLGDSRKTDILCAINASVLPIGAYYSSDANNLNYGLPVNSVDGLWSYLYLMGTQSEPYFGWKKTAKKSSSLNINVKSILGNHGWITKDLKKVLKNGEDVRFGKNGEGSLRGLLSYYLITQCFLSGIVHDTDVIAVYPGHEEGSLNPTMEYFCELLRLIFRQKFRADLLLRHQDAPESKRQRSRDIKDQLRTIRVNPEYRGELKGSTVLIFDDFTTSGNSFETARLMLDQAGAGEVISMAMAKYRAKHRITDVSGDWNAFAPFDPGNHEFRHSEVLGDFNKGPDSHFEKIFKHYANQ